MSSFPEFPRFTESDEFLSFDLLTKTVSPTAGNDGPKNPKQYSWEGQVEQEVVKLSTTSIDSKTKPNDPNVLSKVTIEYQQPSGVKSIWQLEEKRGSMRLYLATTTLIVPGATLARTIAINQFEAGFNFKKPRNMPQAFLYGDILEREGTSTSASSDIADPRQALGRLKSIADALRR